MGAARPRRRSGRAVPARGVPECRQGFFEILRMTGIVQELDSIQLLIRSDRKRADRDDVAIGITLDAVAERVVDRILFARRLRPYPRTARGADRDRAPSR